jgi:hypothetical protein
MFTISAVAGHIADNQKMALDFFNVLFLPDSNVCLHILKFQSPLRVRVMGCGIATYPAHLSAKGGSAFGGFLLPLRGEESLEKISLLPGILHFLF